MEKDCIDRALAKVLAGGNGIEKRFVGTAFFVDPRHLLTAKHCAHALKQGERLFLNNYSGHGECEAKILKCHPERDVALLRMAGRQCPPSESLVQVPREADTPEQDETVTVWGFSPHLSQSDPRRREILTPSAEYDAIRLDQSIAKGMSGGPVIDEAGRFVGLLYARDQDSDCQYVVPVSAFVSWLDEQLTLSRSTQLPSWLKHYLESLQRKLEDMPTDIMLRQLGTRNDDQHLRTRALYVPLHVEGRRIEDPSSVRKADAEPSEPEPLLQALADNPRLVVRGDPGSGKSTFLRYLALRLIGRLQGNIRATGHEEAVPEALDYSLPLFIELKGFYQILLGPDSKPLAQPPSSQAVEDAMLKHLKSKYLALRNAPCNLRTALLDEESLDFKVIWLLDGLDEVNILGEERHHLIRGLTDWSSDLPNHHAVCLTTRPYAYAGHVIPHFENRLVQPLQEREVETFVHQFCWQNGRMFRPDADNDSLTALAEELLRVFEDPLRQALRRIARNPLLLTLTTALYCKKGKDALPHDRAELYGVCLNALLQRWEEKLDRSVVAKNYSIHDTILNPQELHAALDHLGYHAHLRLTQAGKADRENGDLKQELITLAFEPHLHDGYSSDQVIEYLKLHTGLIVGRDQERFAFIHHSFREYLAARYLIQTDAISDLIKTEVACTVDPVWWREVLALAARIGDKFNQNDQCESPLGTTRLLTHLLPYDHDALPDAKNQDKSWQLAELVAHSEAERDRDNSNKPDRAALHARCVYWLVALIEENQLSGSPAQREQASITLGRLGDPRKGVGLDPEFPQLPEIDWVEIPAGKVTLEEGVGDFTIEHPFRIARYPITYCQYQAFVDDLEGYDNSVRWTGFVALQQAPDSSFWSESNHSKTNITWYQAVAFCHWLTTRMRACGRIDPDWEIRLPTEWEWQQAATGGDPDRLYPWGKSYETDCANIDATNELDRQNTEYLGRTSAVGLYRTGATKQGVYDLAGNVWEWCGNKYSDPEETKADESGDSRVLRGGAWFNRASLSRAAYRGSSSPVDSSVGIGFRVLCSSCSF